MKINTKKYIAPDNGYYNKITKKKQIVISFSLRGDENHIIRYGNKSFDSEKSWSHFTISRIGEIYQHFDTDYYSDFIKNKPTKINEEIISIVLSNMGYLTKNNDGLYVNLLNEVCPLERIGKKKVGIFEYWEKIDKEQFDSLVNLCIYICNKNKIKQDSIDFAFINNDIDKFKGIVFRSNYNSENIENNELFDVEYFKNRINEKK